MGWATRHIADLQEGKVVTCRPKGNSMVPIINSGDLVQIEPLVDEPKQDDIVLCKVRGKQFLHKISAVRNNQFQISNNKGYVNGWCSRASIYGIVTRISP